MANTKKSHTDMFECCNRMTTDTNEVLKCAACKKRCHFDCVKTSKDMFKDLTTDYLSSWLCPACNRPRPGKNNSNKVVRAPLSHDNAGNKSDINNGNKRKKTRMSDSDTSMSCDLTLVDVRHVVREELTALLDVFKSNLMSQFGLQLKDISEQLTQVTDSITFMEQQHEELKKEIQVKIKRIDTLENENKILQANLNDLSVRQSQLEQHSRDNNIEIQCIPERKNENLLSIVTQLSSAINYNLRETDVHLCTRIAKQQKNSNRPRSVIVKFSCSRVRDAFLASAINFNRKAERSIDKLNTSHIGIAGESKPIYIAEHLSPSQRALHAAARLKAKELGYRFVWIKRGHIYMRKNETSDYRFIRNMDTLSNLQ